MARTEGRQDSQAKKDHKELKRSSGSRIWGQVSHLGSVENLEKVQSIRDHSTTEPYSGGCSSSDWSFEETKVDKPRPKMVLVQPPSPSLALLSARWKLVHNCSWGGNIVTDDHHKSHISRKNQPLALFRSLSNQAARTEPFLEEDLKSDLVGSVHKERSYNRNSRLGAKYSLKGKHAYITRKTCSGAKWKAWKDLNM